MSNLSPLQLERSFFPQVKLVAQPDPDTHAEFDAETEFEAVQSKENNRAWFVTVRVHVKTTGEKKVPYTGTVECTGQFMVAAAWPEKDIHKLVVVNGTGLLYSAIREMILNITSRGPWPALILPTQSFITTYQKKMESQKAVDQKK